VSSPSCDNQVANLLIVVASEPRTLRRSRLRHRNQWLQAELSARVVALADEPRQHALLTPGEEGPPSLASQGRVPLRRLCSRLFMDGACRESHVAVGPASREDGADRIGEVHRL
jgi:hypothetical protein